MSHLIVDNDAGATPAPYKGTGLAMAAFNRNPLTAYGKNGCLLTCGGGHGGGNATENW
jgi:hypothetical protein